jgi:transposase
VNADLEVVYERVCGIDVHKDEIVVCLITGQRKVETRKYGTLTKDLREMATWLKEKKCQMVAMESTGSYWKPLYNIFELEGIAAKVVNAHHVKTIPGRKTDMSDAQWIAKLQRIDVLKASYIPDKEQREYRELTRYRNSRKEERAREINRLQKMFEGANIKLSSMVSDITGVTGNNLLKLLVQHEKMTVEQVAKVRNKHCKASAQELLDALTGIISPLQRELFSEVQRNIDAQTQQIKRVEAMIKRYTTQAYAIAAKAIEEIPGI